MIEASNMTHREHWRLNGETLSPERQSAALDDIDDLKAENEELERKLEAALDNANESNEGLRASASALYESLACMVTEAKAVGLFKTAPAEKVLANHNRLFGS